MPGTDVPHQWRSSCCRRNRNRCHSPVHGGTRLAPQRTDPTDRDGKHARTQTTYGRFVRRSDCPARGCGTLEELLEIITWKQLGLYLKPIVILNTNGFYNPLLEMLQQAISQNFMRKEHGNIWHVAQTPEEAVNLLYTIPHWSKEIRKFAAIWTSLPYRFLTDSRTLQPARRADRQCTAAL